MAGLISRTMRRFPLTLRFAVFVVLPLVCVSLYFYIDLHRGLPVRDEVLHNPFMSAAATIVRDADGVPQISAATDNDAFFAVGYVHAQDRLWQLELQRRLAKGTLSEIFGKDSLQQDVWFRTLGVYDAARSAWPALSKEAQASLTAYTAGINAGIAAQTKLPVEFRILHVEPQPWTEVDSLAWIKIFAFNLGGNFRAEMSRYLAAQALPEDKYKTFFPDYPGDAPTTIATAAPVRGDAAGMSRLLDFQRSLESQWSLGGRAVGSNAWVVAGKLTKDGGSLLANDPHLGLQIPSLWYAMKVKGNHLDVAGMSLVGLPLVVFGHNAHIAWGGTNMMADAQDLFLEHQDAHNPNAYEVDGHSEPFTMREEEIGIRADFPEQLHRSYLPFKLYVRSTRHGPVISDQFHVFDHPVSLRWTALDDRDTTYEAFYRLGYAGDWPAFESALHAMVAPALNLVYADRAGNIGYLGAGRIPLRKTGDGSLPSPGWDDSYAWTGYVPPERWPQSFNPVSGYIVTANNKIAGSDYPYFISRDWASPARAMRIEQMIVEGTASGRRLTLEDMQAMQGDKVDLPARKMMHALASFAPQGERQRAAWEVVRNWDGVMDADSQAAAIFQVWMRHFRRRLFAAPLQDAWKNPAQAAFSGNLGEGVTLDSLAQIVEQGGSPWCAKEADGRATLPACGKKLQESLQQAILELDKLTGSSDMGKWRWGAVQKTVYTHTPFSDFKPLDRLFEIRIGNGGSINTVDVADSQFVDKEGYLQKFGAAFRQIIALRQDSVTEYYMNSTGESGNVADAHYADMVQPFRDLRYHTLDTMKAAPPQHP